MKKRAFICILAALLLVLSGCCLKHDYAAATCTEPQKCLRCGKTQGSPLGHDAVTDPEKAPTCTEPGLSEGAHCSVCGEILKAQEEIPATGHTAVTDPEKAPTCTEPGLSEGAHCSVCGEILKAQEEIPATGHTFAAATYYEPATCTVCGRKEGTAPGPELFVSALCSSAPAGTGVQEAAPAPGSEVWNLSGQLTDTRGGELIPKGYSLRLTVQKDPAAQRTDVGLTLMNGEKPLATLLVGREGDEFLFRTAEAGAPVYAVKADTVLGWVFPDAGTGAQESPAAPSAQLRDLLQKYLRIFFKNIATARNTEERHGAYTLTALGETVDCTVLTIRPDALDWRTAVIELGAAARQDRTLLHLVREYAAMTYQNLPAQLKLQVTAEKYAENAEREFLEELDEFFADLEQQVTEMDGIRFEFAFEGERLYAAGMMYGARGYGFESAGETETERRAALAFYYEEHAYKESAPVSVPRFDILALNRCKKQGGLLNGELEIGGKRFAAYSVGTAAEKPYMDVRCYIDDVIVGLRLECGEKTELTLSFTSDSGAGGYLSLVGEKTDAVLPPPDGPRTQITDLSGLRSAAEEMIRQIAGSME